MQYKILVVIEYDKKDYDYYLTGFIKKNCVKKVGYTIAEAEQFVRDVIDGLPDFSEDDQIDLYLVQTVQEISEEEKKEFQNALKEIEESIVCQTQWRDEEAYDILKEILDYGSDRIVLFGKNQTIGSRTEESVTVFNSCYKNNKDKTNVKDTDVTLKEMSNGPEKTGRKTDEGEQIASLSKLMRQLAEGGKK